MIIVDTALERREDQGEPIRVGLVGAGYAGRGIARQLLTPLAGMRLAAIANRTVERARGVYAEAGCNRIINAESPAELDLAIETGRACVTSDAHLLCQSPAIDVVVETTGDVEFGAHVAVAAIEGGKHHIMVNAELDATIGPILKARAEAAGVVLSNTDGDEPGVAMNLFRFVKTIGYRPVMAGNIKGFIDRYRTPETQREFARRVKQEPAMITSFADGTKLSMEACILANATGLAAGRRGMFGHACEHVRDVTRHFDPAELLAAPLVDYALGAQPGTGAFVVGYNDEPVKQEYMQYFKMGDGPLYVFYTPYHLPHLQVAVTIGRAALFHDAAVTPLGPPVCDVVAAAKRDLSAGEELDGIGGFTCYGTIENAGAAHDGDLLPMGLSRGCRLVRDVRKDEPVTYGDVVLPESRLCDELRREQTETFCREPAALV